MSTSWPITGYNCSKPQALSQQTPQDAWLLPSLSSFFWLLLPVNQHWVPQASYKGPKAMAHFILASNRNFLGLSFSLEIYAIPIYWCDQIKEYMKVRLNLLEQHKNTFKTFLEMIIVCNCIFDISSNSYPHLLPQAQLRPPCAVLSRLGTSQGFTHGRQAGVRSTNWATVLIFRLMSCHLNSGHTGWENKNKKTKGKNKTKQSTPTTTNTQ